MLPPHESHHGQFQECAAGDVACAMSGVRLIYIVFDPFGKRIVVCAPHCPQSVIVLIYYDTSTSPLNKFGLAVVMGASTACKGAHITIFCVFIQPLFALAT